jgi:DNA-binding response OmpR family regulator
VRWLREHIEKVPSQPIRLLTVRGVGYKFVA